MSNTFKASGILYKSGTNIGLTDHGIDTDSIDSIIESSPDKIPVMRSYDYDPDPANIIGYATLRHTDDGIRANVTFNAMSAKDYQEVFKTDQGLDENRLGFMITYKDKLTKSNQNITKGVIRCVTLKPHNLGGKIDNFGWEEE